MSCRACGGRGWVARFVGDQHGDLCLDCADHATKRAASRVTPTSGNKGPRGRRRRAPAPNLFAGGRTHHTRGIG